MEKPLILGVDPGFGGAMALLNQDDNSILFQDMPIMIFMGRKQIDPYQLAIFIEGHASLISIAAIEDVAAMPGQGVTGMFRFGYTAGLISGIVAAHYIPALKIKPAVWKSSLGLGRSKAESVKKAKNLYPHIANMLTRKKDDGRAEAVLIAHFAKKLTPGATYLS